MALLNYSKYIVALLTGMFFTMHTLAQDSSAGQNFKYVVLQAERINNAAPDYQKFKAKLEEGIKELLVNSKIPMPKNQKELTGKNVHPCDILTCAYTISYATGMMFNARIKCTLTFKDCHKKEVYTVSSGKMTGAIAAADVYLKVFGKIITPGLIKHLTAPK